MWPSPVTPSLGVRVCSVSSLALCPGRAALCPTDLVFSHDVIIFFFCGWIPAALFLFEWQFPVRWSVRASPVTWQSKQRSMEYLIIGRERVKRVGKVGIESVSTVTVSLLDLKKWDQTIAAVLWSEFEWSFCQEKRWRLFVSDLSQPTCPHWLKQAKFFYRIHHVSQSSKRSSSSSSRAVAPQQQRWWRSPLWPRCAVRL